MIMDTGVYSPQLIINTEEWEIVHVDSATNSLMQSTGVVVAHINKVDDVFFKKCQERAKKRYM